MRSNPQPQEVYRHFNGNLYQIVTLAEHSESGETMVIYQALYGDYRAYARPLEMFMEPVDRNKYPEVLQEYRFELQNLQGEAAEQVKTEQIEIEQEETKQLEKEQVEDNENIEGVDPLVMEFLGADTCEQRLRILAGLHHRIDDHMITTMAVAIDVEIEDGDTEDRFEQLRHCLLTMRRFESNR